VGSGGGGADKKCHVVQSIMLDHNLDRERTENAADL